jgi:hypothetical protein
MNKIAYIILLIVITLFSCGKNETEEPIDMGSNYFPVDVGIYSIYKVDSIVWDDFNSTIDTFSFITKLIIDEEFLDNAGRKANWWKKYVKNDSTEYKFISNYTITKTSQRLETVIENIRSIKLIFPFSAGSTWNSNALNNEEEKEAICTDFDYKTSILNKTYEKCASIQYFDEVNLIQEFVYEEIFARNIGMIYKKQIHKELKTNGWRGYFVEYKLIENGKN